MLTGTAVFLNLLIYSIIAAQSFSYIISLRDVQKKLPASSYILFRQLTDKNFMSKFKVVFYAALITGPVALFFTGSSPQSLRFITTVIAYIAFWADTVFMLKGNLPLNTLINAWTTEDYPGDWEQYRDKWLAVFRKRQVANITGFISLLIGVVFG